MPTDTMRRRLARLQEPELPADLQVPDEIRAFVRQHVGLIKSNEAAEVARHYEPSLDWEDALAVRDMINWAWKCIAERGEGILHDDAAWSGIWRGVLWGKVYGD